LSLLTTGSDDFLVAVQAANSASEAQASDLAEELQLPLCAASLNVRDCQDFHLLLICSAGSLSLQQTGRDAPGPVKVEFGSSAMRHRRRGGHNELLGKAVGVGKKPAIRILDATAGLGRDSFVLADLGCFVTLCERNKLIAQLLASELLLAAHSADDWLREVTGRMQLHRGNTRTLDANVLREIEVIYLDPMFPQRGKQAKVKKEMALFHQLLGAGEDSDELLLWALEQDVARIVVKRPPRAPELAGRKPSHVIAGKAVRYDVYVLRGLDA